MATNMSSDRAILIAERAVTTRQETDLAEPIIATVRAHEAEVRSAGIRRLSLFGSLARGEADDDSDVDFAAELAPEARIGLFALGAIERRRSE